MDYGDVQASKLILPNTSNAAIGAVYRVGDTLRYRDSSNTEQILLYAGGNLANIVNPSVARSNLKVPATDNTGITGAAVITNIVTLTQAAYNALGTYSSTTLYIVT